MKLLIVDDDPLVCQSLQLLFGKDQRFDVIGIALHGKEAIALCEQQQPDVILMDIQMPVMDGIEATQIIRTKYPAIHIMMLTTFRDEKNIRLALKAGAAGYLLKSAPIERMADQIKALAAGTTVLDPDVLKTIIEPTKEAIAGLTERETDIVELVAQGFSNKEIAEQLYIGDGTVRNMLTVILDKLEMRDRTQLAIYYWQRNQI